MKKMTLIPIIALVAGCAAPPQSPEEEAARRAAAMRYATTECTIYMGGVSGMKEVLTAAQKEEDTARRLGADNALIAKARQDVEMTWSTGVAMVGEKEMCSNVMSRVAGVLIEQG